MFGRNFRLESGPWIQPVKKALAKSIGIHHAILEVATTLHGVLMEKTLIDSGLIKFLLELHHKANKNNSNGYLIWSHDLAHALVSRLYNLQNDEDGIY